MSGLVQTSSRLEPGIRNQVITKALSELDRAYVFPDVATAMRAHVEQRMKAGAYDAIADPLVFAQMLTEDLRSVSHDGHLRVLYTAAPPVGQNDPGGTKPPPIIEKVETLAGNIGYFKINGFPPATDVGPRISEIMKQLSGTEALIIDLRDNQGGAPDGAMYLAGYFFEQRTLVARIYNRLAGNTSEMWTETVPGALYLKKPVFLLTSRTTFSAGEAAYHLKHLGKAKTVGEATGGGAHRVLGVELGNGFSMSVPITRPINVVTGTDWEGTGVIPDIPASGARALNAAYLASLRALPANSERAETIRRIEADETPRK